MIDHIEVSGLLHPRFARDVVASQYRLGKEGTLEREKVDSNVDKLVNFSRAYNASCSLVSAFLQVIKQQGQAGTFEGTVVPPVGLAGGWGGSVFTDDENRLISETVSFEINIAVFYCSVLFFNRSSELLGHFQGGGLGFAALVGGGEGNWR